MKCLHQPTQRTVQTVQTVDKGLAVLTCFTPRQPEWGITELAVQLKMHKSTVHKILASYQQWGLVAQDPQTRRYRLGLRVLQLAEAVSPSRELREMAADPMDHLARITRETVILRVLDDEEAVTLDARESPEQMRMTSGIGRRNPLYAGASNLILMAYLPEVTVEQLVRRRAPAEHRSRRDLAQYCQRLAQIRSDGYVISTGELEPGVTAIAAPVRDHANRVVAGLSISGPTSRISTDRTPDLITLVCEAAAETSKRLGAPT